MSSSTANPTNVKKIVLNDDKKSKSAKSIDKNLLIKVFRIALTFFYGQFLANAIYDNLIRGVPYLIVEATAFPIIKVSLAGVMIALTIFAMVGIWKKMWILIFPSAIVLIIVSIFSLIVSIIDLVQRKERNVVNSKEFASDITEIIVESLFRIAAIVLKFVMVKFLRSDYTPVPLSA